MRITCLYVALSLVACEAHRDPAPVAAPTGAPTSAGGAATPAPAPTPTPAAPATGAAALPSANSGDAPEISRSVGARGGVVVFWPRVSPRTDDPATRAIAAAVQQRLQALAARALPGRPVDVRPEPERVCPRQGCEAMTVGASLFHTDRGGCVVVALVSGAGQSPQRLVPWVGAVDLRETVVPFREPPEMRIVSRDMARCADVVGQLAAGEEAIVEAIRAAAPAR